MTEPLPPVIAAEILAFALGLLTFIFALIYWTTRKRLTIEIKPTPDGRFSVFYCWGFGWEGHREHFNNVAEVNEFVKRLTAGTWGAGQIKL